MNTLKALSYASIAVEDEAQAIREIAANIAERTWSHFTMSGMPILNGSLQKSSEMKVIQGLISEELQNRVRYELARAFAKMVSEVE